MERSAQEIAAEQWFAQRYPALYAAREAGRATSQAGEVAATATAATIATIATSEPLVSQHFVPVNRFNLPRSTTGRSRKIWR